MALKSYIAKNTFRDSVYLMRLSNTVRNFEGVIEAEVIIGTDHNKKFLRSGGLWSEEIEKEAGANDLIIAVEAEDEEKAEKAIQEALEELNKEAERDNLQSEFIPRTFETAYKYMPGANLALLSIPGRYVEREANQILDQGLHLMIFSDNVPLEAEVSLKKKAQEKGLLVMGPDCGTAIINGVPLAFANEVRRGGIGIVAAAGTGLQEVSCLINNFGEGISQGIGTGGRDVKAEVGGITMLRGLELLAADKETKVIVIISKPPDDEVLDKVLDFAEKVEKPVVVNFLGGDPEKIRAAGCEPALTLKAAAQKAVRLVKEEEITAAVETASTDRELLEKAKSRLNKDQRYLRALYSGGTLAYEALLLMQNMKGKIHTNLSFGNAEKIEDVYKSREHTVIDYGEDEFTQGRLHPMIDPALRNTRIVEEAKDPETAVIMLDLVLGYNAHPDPAGSAVEAIREAKEAAEKDKRQIIFVTTVCGTDEDIQNRGEQVKKLEKEDVLVFPSNADAVSFINELLSS
ncbi:MAG TPA: acyl-CoA synthetase FdrA [Firmicutes bacterium]|nr:acyl-CoA synthetase FdrA [Bacillota bacterium]